MELEFNYITFIGTVLFTSFVMLAMFSSSYALMKLITLNRRVFMEIYIPFIVISFMLETVDAFSIVPDFIKSICTPIALYTLIPIIFEISIILFEGGVQIVYSVSKGIINTIYNFLVNTTIFLFPNINKTKNTDEWLEIFYSYLLPYSYRLNKANKVSIYLNKLLSYLSRSVLKIITRMSE
ncbi:MAG: hypothetical protein AAFV71_19590 [Cyanobacteria bacterium J06633_8]